MAKIWHWVDQPLESVAVKICRKLHRCKASLALNAGVPKSTVQRMGNWKSAAMVNRYAHLADETLRDAAKKVDELVEKSGKDKPATECSEPGVHYAA